jgi:hypothetical protein
MKPLYSIWILVAAPAMVVFASHSSHPASALDAIWPCDGEDQPAYENVGSSRYREALPGGAWNQMSALAAAAANHTAAALCEGECVPPEGCLKNIDWTSDLVTYVSGPSGPNGDSFIYTIDNFVVWGWCTECP